MGSLTPLGEAWYLHFGIFVVWIPTVLISNKMCRGLDNPRRDAWKVILRGCPTWMRYLLYGLFAYAFINFFRGFASFGRGDDRDSLDTIRTFSGHWLVFYYAAFATLYSFHNLTGVRPIRICANGHVGDVEDEFCRKCGARTELTNRERSADGRG